MGAQSNRTAQPLLHDRQSFLLGIVIAIIVMIVDESDYDGCYDSNDDCAVNPHGGTLSAVITTLLPEGLAIHNSGKAFLCVHVGQGSNYFARSLQIVTP